MFCWIWWYILYVGISSTERVELFSDCYGLSWTLAKSWIAVYRIQNMTNSSEFVMSKPRLPSWRVVKSQKPTNQPKPIEWHSYPKILSFVGRLQFFSWINIESIDTTKNQQYDKCFHLSFTHFLEIIPKYTVTFFIRFFSYNLMRSLPNTRPNPSSISLLSTIRFVA